MRLRLTEPVHAVMIDADLVFLDVDADTYFCLPLPPGAAHVEDGDLVTSDAMLAAELARAGLVAEAEGGSTGRPPAPANPRHTARRLLERAPELDARLRPAHLRALVVAIFAGLRARRRTFRQLLAAQTSAARQERPDLDRLLADLSVWRRLTPWVPMDGVCLFRSGMLAAFLRALGHRPTWVFGVRTWPFQAHCWLQVDDIALDDEAERLCAFAPIMGI